MKIIINGSDAALKVDNLLRVSDVIELIKASIDPEHMIANILIDGKELTDTDWTAPVAQFGTAIVEIDTLTPKDFVDMRMAMSASVVRECFMQFRDSRKLFQAAQMQDGNKRLIQAVNTAQAFFEWYGSLMELVPSDGRPRYDITNQVQDITTVCKRICQQQLYQSWWALGETLEKELEPKLDKLEDFCRKFDTASARAA